MSHRSKAIIAQANSTLFNNKEIKKGTIPSSSYTLETPDGDLSFDNSGTSYNSPRLDGHKPSLFAGAERRGWGGIIEEENDSMKDSEPDSPGRPTNDGKCSPAFNRALAEIAEESEMKSCKSYLSPSIKERVNESLDRISRRKSRGTLDDAENDLDGTSFGDSVELVIPSRENTPLE